MTGMKGPRPQCIVYDEVDESGWTAGEEKPLLLVSSTMQHARWWLSEHRPWLNPREVVIVLPDGAHGLRGRHIEDYEIQRYVVHEDLTRLQWDGLDEVEDVIRARVSTYARREPAIDRGVTTMGSKPSSVKAPAAKKKRTRAPKDPFLRLDTPANLPKPKAPTAAEKRATTAGKRARARATQEMFGVTAPKTGRKARKG